jgi:hypothetical protein
MGAVGATPFSPVKARFSEPRGNRRHQLPLRVSFYFPDTESEAIDRLERNPSNTRSKVARVSSTGRGVSTVAEEARRPDCPRFADQRVVAAAVDGSGRC